MKKRINTAIRHRQLAAQDNRCPVCTTDISLKGRSRYVADLGTMLCPRCQILYEGMKKIGKKAANYLVLQL